MNNPLVSVIIPCYNLESKISKCLNSVINQSYSNIEIICINDASTDKTLDVLHSFASKDNRVNVIDLTKNAGAANARKVGINNSKGKYIAFIDGDDWIKKDYFEVLVKACDSDIVVCCYHQAAYKRISLRKCDTRPDLIGKRVADQELTDLHYAFFGISIFPLYMCIKLYDKSLFDVTIPDFGVFFQDDVLLNMHIFKNVKSIRFINYSGYYYRCGGGSDNRTQQYINDMKKVYAFKKSALEDNGSPFHGLNNAQNYILVELKNCLYIYIKHLIDKYGDTVAHNQLLTELQDPIYQDFKLFDGDFSDYAKQPMYQSVIEKDIPTVIALAKNEAVLNRSRFKEKLKQIARQILNL